MSKLRPLSKDEDLLAIPVDEPVLVELPGAASSEEGDGIVEPADNPLKGEPKAKAEPEQDAGVTALQKQIADMQRANSERETRLARERDEARRDADEARTQAADTEADLVQNGLTSAQAEAKSARAALKSAIDAGDVDAQADAQERIGRAAADIRDFERAAATIAERPKPEPRRTEQPSDIIAVIDSMQLMPTEKAWLKEHTDALLDPGRKAELDAAYFKATRKGIVRGTPAYFQFLETEMEYTKPAARTDEGAEERTVVPAAPVSRESRTVSGRQSVPTRIQLTPEQRQLARDMGITDIAYARGVQQLEAEKQRDPEKFARRA